MGYDLSYWYLSKIASHDSRSLIEHDEDLVGTNDDREILSTLAHYPRMAWFIN